MTERQEILLCVNTLNWISRLEGLAQKITQFNASMIGQFLAAKLAQPAGRATSLPSLSGKELSERLEDAVVMPIILAHIYRATELLKPNLSDEGKRAVERFAKTHNTEEVRDLRNVLEHLEDYIAGEGRKPELVVNAEPNPGFGQGPDQPLYLGVFGKKYEVGAVIESAISLRDVIRARKRELCAR